MSRESYAGPEERLSLTVDSLNAVDLHDIPKQFDGKIRKVKLGIVFGRASHTALGLKDMINDGIEVTFDGKFSETETQMPNAIMSYEEDGYHRLTVNAGATYNAIAAAASAARHSKIVLALPADQPNHIEEELDKLEKANEQLNRQQKITHLMCDVGGIALARARDHYTIIATGLYVPGTNPSDKDVRMTPAEALDAGADEVSIGRSITSAPDYEMRRAVDSILDDMARVL